MNGIDQSSIVLEARGLTKRFSGFTAVNNVNLRVKSGSIHALIGPNGAGKSTLFNLLTKFLAPSEGQIFYKGEDITGLEASQIARKGLVRSFQISSVFPGLSVRDNVRIALQERTGLSFKFWKPERVLNHLHGRVEELLALVDLTWAAHLPAAELSYGRKRALELATTLALEPEVLLLDEPMAGLGTEDIERITQLIKQVSANRTVLMVEHNLGVVETLSDYVTVLTRGEVLVEGSYADVAAHPAVMEAYMGTAHV